MPSKLLTTLSFSLSVHGSSEKLLVGDLKKSQKNCLLNYFFYFLLLSSWGLKGPIIGDHIQEIFFLSGIRTFSLIFCEFLKCTSSPLLGTNGPGLGLSNVPSLLNLQWILSGSTGFFNADFKGGGLWCSMCLSMPFNFDMWKLPSLYWSGGRSGLWKWGFTRIEWDKATCFDVPDRLGGPLKGCAWTGLGDSERL